MTKATKTSATGAKPASTSKKPQRELFSEKLSDKPKKIAAKKPSSVKRPATKKPAEKCSNACGSCKSSQTVESLVASPEGVKSLTDPVLNTVFGTISITEGQQDLLDHIRTNYKEAVVKHGVEPIELSDCQDEQISPIVIAVKSGVFKEETTTISSVPYRRFSAVVLSDRGITRTSFLLEDLQSNGFEYEAGTCLLNYAPVAVLGPELSKFPHVHGESLIESFRKVFEDKTAGRFILATVSISI